MVTVAIGLLAGLAGGCAAPDVRLQSSLKIPYDSATWEYAGHPGHKFTTTHYEIYTTLRDDLLVKSLPGLMESAFTEYQKLVPAAREPADRMQVYLFATRAEWADFTRRFTGPRAALFLKVRNGGYSEGGVSVIQYVMHQTTFPLMTHEGFHQYLHEYVSTNVPAWLNEGLATTFEGQRWTSQGFAGFDPSHNPARRNVLAESLLKDKLFPLSELLETNAGNVVHLSSRTVGTYYAQLWALVLFLREGENGRYAADFRRLLNQLGSPDLEQSARASHIWSDNEQYSYGEALFRFFITDDMEAAEQQYLTFMREKFLTAR